MDQKSGRDQGEDQADSVSDLSRTLDAHRVAVEEFIATATAVPSERWRTPRAPGKWSPGQVVEHLALAYEVNRGVLHGVSPGMQAPRLLRPLIRWIGLNPVLRRGRFIPGSKSPKVFRPSDSPADQPALLARVRAAIEAFHADAGKVESKTLDHPFFGRLGVGDFVRLQEIHSRHHRGQISSS